MDALGCSKSTISYHVSPGGKQKVRAREARHREDSPTLLHVKRVWHFQHPRTPSINKTPWYQHPTHRQTRKAITQKSHQFQKTMTFNYKDVHKKHGDHFPCALTGRPLNWNNPEDYQYDHIIPIARGGDNTINRPVQRSRTAPGIQNVQAHRQDYEWLIALANLYDQGYPTIPHGHTETKKAKANLENQNCEDRYSRGT